MKRSEPYPSVRIDLFKIDSKIYLSEFRFLQPEGLAVNENPRVDKR